MHFYVRLCSFISTQKIHCWLEILHRSKLNKVPTTMLELCMGRGHTPWGYKELFIGCHGYF